MFLTVNGNIQYKPPYTQSYLDMIWETTRVFPERKRNVENNYFKYLPNTSTLVIKAQYCVMFLNFKNRLINH